MVGADAKGTVAAARKGAAAQAGKIRIRPSEKILVLGDYQTGKTRLVKYVLALQPRVWVFDPTHAFPKGQRDLQAAAREFVATGRGVFQPGRRDIDAEFEKWCEIALRLSNCLAFIDEPAMIKKKPQALLDLHRLGHKRGVGCAIATHSLWDVPHVLQQCHHLFVFRVDRVVDLNALRQLLPEEAVSWIQTAPKFHYWYRGGGQSEAKPPLPRP